MNYASRLSPTGYLEIVRHPQPTQLGQAWREASGRALDSLPRYDPNNSWSVDLRGWNPGPLDLRERSADLEQAIFDSHTGWPSQLPASFHPQQIMELGKDPGLGVRELHARGITGKGVGIGILDQTLLTGHIEYRHQLRLYEEIHVPLMDAEMHGPAVASIAVGKTIGVAPEADLYYIAESHGVFHPEVPGGEKDRFDWDFAWLAQSIDRLLEVNRGLPEARKIRVISISVGWRQQQKGYTQMVDSLRRAREQGVFVISCALQESHGLAFHGLGRGPTGDPNQFSSYGPAHFSRKESKCGEEILARAQLLVPMNSRCLASCTGLEDYAFFPQGGWSWVVPWLAGLYALACQIQPDITPAGFWGKALETGVPLVVDACVLGTMAHPARLLGA